MIPSERHILETSPSVIDTVPQIVEDGGGQMVEESVEIEMLVHPVSEQTVDEVDAAILSHQTWLRD